MSERRSRCREGMDEGRRAWLRHGFRATGLSGWERGRSVAPEVNAPEAQQQAMEQQALEQQARVLESSLERVRRRLDDLAKVPSQE